MLVLLLEDDMQTNKLQYCVRAAMNEDTPEIMAKNRLPWRSVDDAIVYFDIVATSGFPLVESFPLKNCTCKFCTAYQRKNIARKDQHMVDE